MSGRRLPWTQPFASFLHRALCTGMPLVAVALLGVVWPSLCEGKTGPVWSYEPTTGFVDEPLAFDTQGGRLAYIHTDSARFLTIKVLSTEGFKETNSIDLEDVTVIPQKLAFTPDGAHLILVWMDGRKGTISATLLDIKSGKKKKTVGPADKAALVHHKGQPCLSLIDTKMDNKGGNVISVRVFRQKDFRPAGQGRAVVAANQMVKPPNLRFLYWERGHLTLVGMKKGKYDKKRDIRLPERAVRYNIVTKKEVWSQEPEDVVQWVKATNMRTDHPGVFRFLQVSDDLKQLLLGDRENQLSPVSLPVNWVLYEPKSLVQWETADGDGLFFSLTVDPVNRLAVARKKADKERMDLYRLEPGPKASLLGQVLTESREFLWTVGPNHFTYLRKLKGFGRGGDRLVVYPIAP